MLLRMSHLVRDHFQLILQEVQVLIRKFNHYFITGISVMEISALMLTQHISLLHQ
jgi:hypothetical protein